MVQNPFCNKLEKFNISPAEPANQTLFIGYGIYDIEKNSVRIYVSSRGTASSGTDITSAIPQKYRPSASVQLIGTINENSAGSTIFLTTGGIITESFSGSYTSAMAIGEYIL